MPTDTLQLAALQKKVKTVFKKMSDPNNAIIITTSTDSTLKRSREAGILGENLPFIAPPKWQTLQLSGARYYRDDIGLGLGLVEEWFTATATLDEDNKILAPVVNNLIPSTIRPPRVISQPVILKERSERNWKILEPGPNTPRLRIPLLASEPSCRAVYVFQLLSARPARANTKQASYAELWKLSFEKAIVDLVSKIARLLLPVEPIRISTLTDFLS